MYLTFSRVKEAAYLLSGLSSRIRLEDGETASAIFTIVSVENVGFIPLTGEEIERSEKKKGDKKKKKKKCRRRGEWEKKRYKGWYKKEKGSWDGYQVTEQWGSSVDVRRGGPIVWWDAGTWLAIPRRTVYSQ